MQASTETNLKLLLIVLVFFLSMSLMSNYRNYRISKQYERFFGANILDPFNLTVYPSDPESTLPATAVPNQLVVFFGDSRALEWPAPTYNDQRWHFVNRGINAQTSIQAAGRFDHHVIPLNPDVVIIQVGVNDLRLIPMFPEQRANIIANTKKAVDKMVSDSTWNGAHVILSTIFPVGNPNLEQKLLGQSPQIITAVREVNQHILSLASDRVSVINTDPILGQPNGIARLEYQSDFLHINQRGYNALNNELMHILTTLEVHYGDQETSR